jgi:hypothetical protein
MPLKTSKKSHKKQNPNKYTKRNDKTPTTKLFQIDLYHNLAFPCLASPSPAHPCRAFPCLSLPRLAMPFPA